MTANFSKNLSFSLNLDAKMQSPSSELPIEETRHRSPKIGGFVPFSCCDWPGQLAAVVFISGCPWRCLYCHNPHLQKRVSATNDGSWESLLDWLKTRKGLLDGLVFCGGEPLVEPCLPSMLKQVKEQGFSVALHTGGAYPERLSNCLPIVDWVGLDIKAPFNEYERVTQVRDSGKWAHQSLSLLLASGIPFECRTTVHPALLSDDHLLSIGKTLAAAGVEHYAVQQFRAQGCAHSPLCASLPHQQVPYPSLSTKKALEQLFPNFILREEFK